MTRPRAVQAEQAADLLGIHVFDLARALRKQAAAEAERQAGVISRGDERPNWGSAKRILWAAEAAEEAWDSVLAVEEETEGAR